MDAGGGVGDRDDVPSGRETQRLTGAPDTVDADIAAAITIQTLFRGFRARKLYGQMLYEKYLREEEEQDQGDRRRLREGLAFVESHHLKEEMELEEILQMARELHEERAAVQIQRAFRRHRAGLAHSGAEGTEQEETTQKVEDPYSFRRLRPRRQSSKISHSPGSASGGDTSTLSPAERLGNIRKSYSAALPPLKFAAPEISLFADSPQPRGSPGDTIVLDSRRARLLHHHSKKPHAHTETAITFPQPPQSPHTSSISSRSSSLSSMNDADGTGSLRRRSSNTLVDLDPDPTHSVSREVASRLTLPQLRRRVEELTALVDERSKGLVSLLERREALKAERQVKEALIEQLVARMKQDPPT